MLEYFPNKQHEGGYREHILHTFFSFIWIVENEKNQNCKGKHMKPVDIEGIWKEWERWASGPWDRAKNVTKEIQVRSFLSLFS